MAIRMVDDPNDPNEYRDDEGGRRGPYPSNTGGGGGGGLLALLPLLLGLFRKPGGLLLLLLLVGGYFLLTQRGCSGLMGDESSSRNFGLGGTLDPREFAKAPVYEGLTEDDIRNPLPGYVSLARFAPPRQDQGEQGSCVAWSAAYAAHTILASAHNGTNPVQQAFSPAYMYNQIGLAGCQGSYIIRAMELMQQRGSVPFNAFPYNPNDCRRMPGGDLHQLAAANRIHGYSRLTSTEDVRGINIRAIKEHLAKDAPVVIGMMVGGSFLEGMMGRKVWEPTQRDYSMMGYGGHAMAVIGYDDKLAGGAFQIMNSWGPQWGENGFGWIRYADFKEFVREAYGINPPPKSAVTSLDCEIGLVEVDAATAKPKAYIPLKSGGVNTFVTTQPVAKGTRFKVEVRNATPCYVYVFGQETDGSSYTLFPYPLANNPSKTAYTPYCGVTGYRLFPKDKSMMADDVGNKDYMAVVVSLRELDWYQLNQRISASRGAYAQSVSSALASAGVASLQVSSTGKGNMKFTAPTGVDGVAYAVVEVDKR